jgi:hypothetical protein
MEIKNYNQKNTYYNLFDVMDTSGKETNLAKFLAYMMSKHSCVFKRVIQLIINTGSFEDKVICESKIKGKNAKKLLERSDIGIEHCYSKEDLNSEDAGRTDIEIKIYDDSKSKIDIFFVLECKVHSNKATIEQFEKYKNIFKLKNNEADFQFFVYLSDQNGINLFDNDIIIIDLNWRDIINSLYEYQDINEEIMQFINYFERSYGMSNQKEILVQDLGVTKETDRYNNCVYRRDKVNGSPLYFAPYFTRNADNKKNTLPEGIHSISKILGIITTNDIKWEKVEDSCNQFLDMVSCKFDKDEIGTELFEKYSNDLLAKWKIGIKGDELFLSNIDFQRAELLKKLKEKKDQLNKRRKQIDDGKKYKYGKSIVNLDNEIEELKSALTTEKSINEYWERQVYTYYFLDQPVRLQVPLLKDRGIEKGRGKNWIAAAITKNRCVNFSDFIEHSILVEKDSSD